MIDPITPSVLVRWNGKTYPLQLTLGALAGASRVLQADMLGADMMLIPGSAAGPMYLFALLHRQFPGVTIGDCEDAFFESPEATEHYTEVVEEAKKQLEPLIQKYEQHRASKEAKKTGPLAVPHSGDTSGQPESSS